MPDDQRPEVTMIRIEQDELYAVVEEMVERAAAGETIVIMRGGVPVAQLEPGPPPTDVEVLG